MNNIDIITNIMKNLGASDAISLRNRSSEMDGTNIIREEEKIPDFDKNRDYSNWPVGSPVSDEDQIWILIQPHNAANYDGRPRTLRALWSLCHTKDPNKAKPFVLPEGTSGMYMTDECIIEDGVIYQCLQDNVIYPPSELQSVWAIVTL